MKDKKISFIKEKELSKKADKLYREFVESGFVENPIKAKFLAFREIKKETKLKDLF